MKSESLHIKLQPLPHCPACGDIRRRVLFPIQGSSLHQCFGCSLRYLDPCLSSEAMKSAYESEETLSALHRFHEGYYDYGDLVTETKTLKDFRRGLELLEKYLPASARSIFDVGFGNGLFLALAKQRGWQVRGIDTSPKNRERAMQKYGLALEQASFEDYAGAEGSYDAISFWDVVEHLADPHPVLEKAGRLLKPRGLILIGLPNDPSFLSRVAAFFYRVSFGKIRKGIETLYFLEHVAYYNRGTLERLMKSEGFELRDSFPTSTDLARFYLPLADRIAARVFLTLGRWFGLENRLVAVFQKTDL